MKTEKLLKQKNYCTTGALKDKKDRRDYKASGILCSQKEYPPIVSVECEFDPKNQFGRGSCTSQAQAHHKERQEKKRLSARFVMANVKTLIEKNTGYGGHTRNSFKAVNKWGIPEEHLLPEPAPNMSWEEYIDANKIDKSVYENAVEHKSESYWSIQKTVNDIKDVLQTGNTVVISMQWYSEFNKLDKNGFLHKGINGAGGHAVEIIEANDELQAFKVKNSWGKGWGKDGYFYIRYSEMNLIWDLWTSLDIPDDLPVDNYYGLFRQPIDTWREMYIVVQCLIRYQRIPSRREVNALLAYWDYDEVFNGTKGDVWLYYTRFEAYRKGLI